MKIRMYNYSYEQHAAPRTDGFTLLEHSFGGQHRTVTTTPEEVIYHLLARIKPLGDGPRRLAEIHKELGDELARMVHAKVVRPDSSVPTSPHP